MIAGFGEKEIFPSAVSYAFEGIAFGKLKHTQNSHMQANRDSQSIIMPFAQGEMVSTFVEGIDPAFREFLYAYFHEFITNYPSNILSAIPELTDVSKAEFKSKLDDIAKSVIEDFSEKTSGYARQYHVDPVLQAVSALPKDELAAMAESLVNLTSFNTTLSV